MFRKSKPFILALFAAYFLHLTTAAPQTLVATPLGEPTASEAQAGVSEFEAACKGPEHNSDQCTIGSFFQQYPSTGNIRWSVSYLNPSDHVDQYSDSAGCGKTCHKAIKKQCGKTQNWQCWFADDGFPDGNPRRMIMEFGTSKSRCVDGTRLRTALSTCTNNDVVLPRLSTKESIKDEKGLLGYTKYKHKKYKTLSKEEDEKILGTA